MKNNIFSDKISEKWKTQQIKRENDNFLLDFLHEKWLSKKKKILTAFGIQKKSVFLQEEWKLSFIDGIKKWITEENKIYFYSKTVKNWSDIN